MLGMTPGSDECPDRVVRAFKTRLAAPSDCNAPAMESDGDILRQTQGDQAMTCQRCGTANPTGARFCANCGAMFTGTTYQTAARGAIVSQNLALVSLVGIVLGFIGGALVGAYVFVPLGGWGTVLGVASPIIGMVVGHRLLMELLAR